MKNSVYRGIKGVVKKVDVEMPSEPGPKEVLIKITHSSLCGSDVHLISYGIALVHEGVGVVEKIGNEVTQLKVEDRAGGGYLRNSCGHCSYCTKGQDISCYERNYFREADFNSGTFGDYRIPLQSCLCTHCILILTRHRRRVLRPQNPRLHGRRRGPRPLHCGGSTVYNAITSSAKLGDRIGVIGIGGLGHLAIQFASKLGYETIVSITLASKEAEAKSFGASEIYLLESPEKIVKPVDLLIVTSGKYPDWTKFTRKDVLARQGNIIALSAPTAPIELPSFPFFFDTYNFKSSLVASRGVHENMLTFAAHHGIKPQIEKFPFTEEGMHEAIEKMNAGKLRYRGVLVAE